MPTSSDGDRPLPATARGRETRRAFVRAGRVVFAAEGFLGATITGIAEEAGRSVASFYNYFDSKEDLLAELAAGFNAELQEATAEPFRRGLPPRQALREAIRRFWEIFRERRGELVGVFQAAMTNDSFARRWQTIRSDGIRVIEAGIRNAQRDGFCPDLEPRLAASALSSMIEMFSYVWLVWDGDDIDREVDDEAAIETLWQLWWHGIYWRPGDGDEPSRASR